MSAMVDKIFYTCFIVLLLALPRAISARQSNLVANPGFEQGARSWVIRTASIDQTVQRSGKASLKYTNDDPKNYRVILTHINVKGGEVLSFSAWVKGENIQPASFGKKGAGIYLHAYDKDDRSLGGSNPPTPSGTFDWTPVEGVFEVPEKASRIAVSLYLVRGNTGTAWFDDIVVTPVSWKEVVTVQPSLRSLAKKGEASKLLDVQARKTASEGVYLDDEGFTVKDGERIFPFGIYIGKAEQQGIWSQEDLHLKRINEAGFNTVLSYVHGDRKDAGQYLDKLHQLGLYSIFSLSYLYDGNEFYKAIDGQRAAQRVGELAKELKHKQALLSWYTGDEIELSHLFAAKQNYDAIKKEDDAHPVFQVTNKLNIIPQLLSVTDVIGTDPYPVGKTSPPNLRQVIDWTGAAVTGAGSQKAVWQVVQIFNKVAFQSELQEEYMDPSPAHIQNMLYQSIIGGAKGILFYSYHHLWYGKNSQGKVAFSEEVYSRRWKEVATIASQFRDIIPVILANDVINTPEVTTDNGVICKAWRYEGEEYLMIANTLDQAADIKISGKSVQLEPFDSKWIKL